MTDETMTEAPRHLTLTSEGTRHKVVLDGHDLTDSLYAVDLRLAANELPQALLHLAGNAAADGAAFDGLARVSVAAPGTDMEATARFLGAIDADKLTQDALNRQDLGYGPSAATQAILAQLIDYALGKD